MCLRLASDQLMGGGGGFRGGSWAWDVSWPYS